ncbi:MAG: helix-turn-helix domain-containing protein [Acidobacteriota bacterium]
MNKEIAVRLKSFVHALGCKQKDIAQSLGITPGALSAAITGQNYLSLDRLGILATIYRLNIQWLLTGEGGMFVGGPAADAARIAAPAAKPFVGAGRPGRMFTAPAPDPITQLERLAVLKEKGLLTDDELAALKAKILSS